MVEDPMVIFEDGQESLLYFPRFFAPQLFSVLKADVPWQQRQIRMFGKTHDEPRLTAWFGPGYTYSGVEQQPAAFPPFLEDLRYRLCERFNFPFNGVLLNYYRDGKDYMGWHRDNEKSMDQRCIASASFGTERRFSVRSIHSGKKTDILLESGSLLLMNNLQQNWQHAIPRSLRTPGERINLTFRHILS